MIAAAVLAAAAIVVWDMSQPRSGTLFEAAAADLTVTDANAGIAYTVPHDWTPGPTAVFSSGTVRNEAAARAAVYAFAAAPLTGELSSTTPTVVGDNAFIYPYPEASRQVLLSEPATVDGYAAYRVAWEFSSPGQEPMYVHLLHILTDRHSVFVLGATMPADEDHRARIDGILASVTLLAA